MMKSIKVLIIFAIISVLIWCGLIYFQILGNFNLFSANITKTALIDLTNQERQKFNLAALNENPLLDRAAYLKALDMVKNGYFDHNSPGGTKPWYWFDQSGYDYKYAGENLAIGFTDSGAVNNAWIASPTHRANILNRNYREIGIAILNTYFQGSPAVIVVQLFGDKQNE